MIKNILFDLDGTLLPMDFNYFFKLYLDSMQEYFKDIYNNENEFGKIMLDAVNLMYKNDGSKTNEEIFWDYIKSLNKGEKEIIEQKLDEYYTNSFIKAKDATGFTPYASLIIKELKDKGYNIILATNPYFPKKATLERIKWAGLNKDDFSLITTYENSHFTKPNPKYYEEIITKLNLNKEECLMIGNDTIEDLAILNLGIPCIILSDWILNKNNYDLSKTITIKDLYNKIKQYPSLK